LFGFSYAQVGGSLKKNTKHGNIFKSLIPEKIKGGKNRGQCTEKKKKESYPPRANPIGEKIVTRVKEKAAKP